MPSLFWCLTSGSWSGTRTSAGPSAAEAQPGQSERPWAVTEAQAPGGLKVQRGGRPLSCLYSEGCHCGQNQRLGSLGIGCSHHHHHLHHHLHCHCCCLRVRHYQLFLLLLLDLKATYPVSLVTRLEDQLHPQHHRSYPMVKHRRRTMKRRSPFSDPPPLHMLRYVSLDRLFQDDHQ